MTVVSLEAFGGSENIGPKLKRPQPCGDCNSSESNGYEYGV